MISVLSATENDYYAMPLPFVVYSWRKIGVATLVFIPSGNNPKLHLAKQYCIGTQFLEFNCPDHKIPTYSQVIRLFGAAASAYFMTPDSVMITGDSDMAVFGDFFETLEDGKIHVVGNDLTPEEQYPMCFCAMPIKDWITCLDMETKDHQQCADELIEPIQSTNLRGDAWSLDQWYLKKMLLPYTDSIVFHPRSNGQNQFATRRADRDGWHFDPYNLIDAHLPRPLTDESNFNKVKELFHLKYPEDDLSWMSQFRNEYLKLL